MTKEHLGIALALRLPVFVVVTKVCDARIRSAPEPIASQIDICPDNIREQTMKQLFKILKSSAAKKFPCIISSERSSHHNS